MRLRGQQLGGDGRQVRADDDRAVVGVRPRRAGPVRSTQPVVTPTVEAPIGGKIIAGDDEKDPDALAGHVTGLLE